MVEPLLQNLLASRYRLTAIITLTFVTGLVTVLPQADEYTGLRQRQNTVENQLVHARATASRVDQFAERVEQQISRLKELEGRAVSEQDVHDFRSSIVNLVREAGCQIIRIDVGSARSRAWHTGDDPIGEKKSIKKRGTEYSLVSQQLTLSVRGSLPNLKTLLAALHERNVLAHPKQFSLKPLTAAESKELALDLELWLFDLERQNSAST